MDCLTCKGIGRIRGNPCRRCDATGVTHYAIDPEQFSTPWVRAVNLIHGFGQAFESVRSSAPTAHIPKDLSKLRSPWDAQPAAEPQPGVIPKMGWASELPRPESGKPPGYDPWYIKVLVVVVMILAIGGFYAAWRALAYLIFQVWLGIPYEGSECAWC